MSDFKSFLKNNLPWFMRQTLPVLRLNWSRRKPPFSGVYDAFDERAGTAGYESREWTGQCRHVAELCRRRIGQAIPDSLSASKALLPVVVSTLAACQDTIKVLDFGGAGGLDFANLLAQTNDRVPRLSYHVVDVEAACEAGRSVWHDDSRISFSSSLPEAGHFDIVYAYSAIHCVSDYKALLRRMAGYRPAVMLFCKHPVHAGEAFARKQVNMGPRREVMQWVLSLGEVEALLSEEGYRLIFRGKGEDQYNVDHYDAPYRVGDVVNMVFVRANQSS